METLILSLDPPIVPIPDAWVPPPPQPDQGWGMWPEVNVGDNMDAEVNQEQPQQEDVQEQASISANFYLEIL